MGLINLQTDLASLKYGSNKPIIRHEMGNTISPSDARFDDVKRLAGILTRAPGLKFAANQSLLQSAKIGSAVGNKLASGGTLAGAVLAGVGQAVKGAVGAGLFLSANARRAGTGYHGINPTVANSYLKAGKEDQTGQQEGFLGAIQAVQNTISNVAQAIGAQSSNYHAGKEILGGAQNVEFSPANGDLYKSDGKDQGTSQIKVNGESTVVRSKAYKNFDDPVDDKVKYLENGKSVNHIKLGDKLSKDDLLSSKSRYYLGKGDELQRTKPLTEALGVEEEDLIPFVFNFYTPGEGNTDKFLYFRALLDSMSDSYSANWNATKYVGRAEEFYNYTGFGRTFSFAFKAAAFSRNDLFPIYSKLNHLVGSTAPTYGDGGLFMRGTLLKLTIGDYLYEQNGFLTSVSLSWNTDYQWEISKPYLRVPHLLDVSCEFTPIHSFNPEFGKEEKRFIGRIGDTTPGSSGDFSGATGESATSGNASDFSSFTGQSSNPSDFSRFLGGG